MTDLEKWAIFFRYASEPQHRETVNKVIESKEAIQMAGNLLMNISQDERERAVFRSRRMYQTDLESNLATAEDRGKKIGVEIGKDIGKAEEKAAIARNLMKLGIPLDQITAATGLTHQEIENLNR